MNFKYKAVDASGQILIGALTATSESEAINLVRGRKLRLIQLDVEDDKPKDIEIPFFQAKVKISDISMFCKQLSTMLKAGVPLSRALDIQTAQTVNKVLMNAIVQVSSYIKQGMPLSKAMRQFPNIFPLLLLNMIEAGELTGKLDEVLASMHVHYDKENKLNNRIQGAMIYPMVLGGLTIGIVILMLTFVMPMFASMFTSIELPLPTRILLGLSDSLRGFWYIYIIVIVGLIIGFRMFVQSNGGRHVYDQIKLSIPKIKGLMISIVTARFTRTLSTLLSSGISIIKALESSAEITNNVIVIDSMAGVINDVKKGVSLSSLLRKSQIFPPMMVSMLSVGEETGSIDEMLSKTADYYDEELDTALSRLVALLEPMMILFMGVAVGLIVVAMYLPMFEMFNAMEF
ncbi:MAG: type II secretion system F family protein [Clostridiales bacterium]|nr:type II secretion system F family protein [Clostridiales bacterium]MDR2749460.1 type II secretion system F family protein [Clostridiales bacterium]